LLSIRRNVESIVIPSEEQPLDLHPLDFEEFLWALGNTTTFPVLHKAYEQKTPLGAPLHRKIMNDFRLYMLIGGMPQAIMAYLDKKDFKKVDEVKRDILTLYRNDIAKFAGKNQYKVLSIFDEIPSQLSKREKKFNLSSVSKTARLRTYEEAFMWLEDAMITNTAFNTRDPNIGLGLSGDFSTRKSYMADTGLLVTHAFYDNSYSENELYKSILFDKLNINEGMLMENIVAQTLKTNSHRLFFIPDMIKKTGSITWR